MKTISVPQPWAQLIVRGAKAIETRPYQVEPGEYLIYSAPADEQDIRRISAQPYFNWFIESDEQLPIGKFVGKVRIMRVDPVEKIILADKWHHAFLTRAEKEVECALGDYSPGNFAWTLENPVEFDQDQSLLCSEDGGDWHFNCEIVGTVPGLKVNGINPQSSQQKI